MVSCVHIVKVVQMQGKALTERERGSCQELRDAPSDFERNQQHCWLKTRHRIAGYGSNQDGFCLVHNRDCAHE